MTYFEIISELLLYGLTAICFYLPYKNNSKITAWTVSIVLGLLISWTIIADLDFLVIFIWPIILIFQTIFLSFWIFQSRGRRKIGVIVSSFITFSFLLLVMQPWISDLTFNSNDAKEIMQYHGFELTDDIDLIKNESGGFRDYYHTFTIKISQADHNRITKEIRRSKDFYRYETLELIGKLPTVDWKTNDTMNYETKAHYVREYYSDKKMKDGTFHFRFYLSKNTNELEYIGSNE